MRTIDQSSGHPGTWAKLRGDVRLAKRIFLMIVGYWTFGRRLRKRYEQREANGETFWVDQRGGPDGD